MVLKSFFANLFGMKCGRKLPVLILILASLLSSTAVAQQAGADGLGDKLYPQLGNGGYDVQHYDITLRFSPAENNITATTVISAAATDDLSSFNLDLYGLSVSSVTVDGAPADFAREDSELIITPAQSLAAGTLFSVTVDYAGVPEPISDPGVPFISLGWQTWEDGFHGPVSQPSGAMNWFPCNNHPSDKATYSMNITVPAQLTAAANGVLTKVIENDDGTRTFAWRLEEPMTSYLTIVAIGDYVEVRDDSGPVPIRNYFPRDADASLINGFGITQEMMAWLIETLGDYPFAEYGVVVLPGFPAALETQTLSVFGASAPDPTVIMHELVHQWFGNSVAPARWQDTWLNEGFATYFMALWLEETLGLSAVENFFAFAADPEFELPAPGNIDITQLFGLGVYFRGALTLHALRAEVGDDIFFAILRSYYDEYAHSIVTTDDFIAVAESVSGRDLGELFDAWLYSEAMPDLP